MQCFADCLIEAVRAKKNPCVVGLDPRIDWMPDFVRAGRATLSRDAIRSTISDFQELVLDAVADLVPAVKPQLAFYEQYGLGGLEAFENTVAAARARGLLVIADGKRNDISSTAEAYATAFLSDTGFSCDSMTVTPYLGRDSLVPFANACAQHAKGLFVVLKTSNPGSRDFQDQPLQGTGRPLYEAIAGVIRELGDKLVGASGYSSIGAVIGATYPEEGARLRELMPRAIILVPGYGAQGGSARNAAVCFDAHGMGALVSSSRGITYGASDRTSSRQDLLTAIRDRTLRMIDDIGRAVSAPARV